MIVFTWLSLEQFSAGGQIQIVPCEALLFYTLSDLLHASSVKIEGALAACPNWIPRW
jgi:hypothetical protein